LSDPAKHFDTSGKSPVHPTDIRNIFAFIYLTTEWPPGEPIP
jgi:hypothetical protein